MERETSHFPVNRPATTGAQEQKALASAILGVCMKGAFYLCPNWVKVSYRLDPAFCLQAHHSNPLNNT